MKIVACISAVLCVWTVVSLADGPSDAEVTHRVKHALDADFRFRAAEVSLSTSVGTVTLTGQVSTYLQKLDIERVVKRVDGVRLVVNLIDVQRTDRRDSEIAEDIKARLAQHSFVMPKELSLEVKNGRVVMKGVVKTWSEKRQCERVAREVAGVLNVENELQVSLDSMRADALIQQDVKAAFARDMLLSEFPIRVTVRKGQVLLEGAIQNLFLWDRSSNKALRVPGVVNVQNHLKVLAPESLAEVVDLQVSSDERTRENVDRELVGDYRIESDKITVAVRSRIVTLRGKVPTMFQRQLAEIDARNVLGVVRVENEIAVDAEPRADEDILGDVRSAVASDARLGSTSFGIAVKEATVTLSGEVADFNSKQRAERVVGRIRGVRDIRNELKVAWSPTISDSSLMKRISQSLAYNTQTRSVAKHIRVAVNAGVVGLSGRVARWSERREAERVARLTDGVRSVDNQLLVGGGQTQK